MSGPVRVDRLDSGLTVVTERMPHVRSVAFGFWVGVGARDEAPELAGASHFLEHLLFKGTATRSARQIAEAVDEVGGDLNAFTTKEYTTFEVRLGADHADLGLDILSDIVWSPAFRPDEVEAERSVILEEILMAHDEPADLVHDLFAEAAFPDHPLGRSTLGTEDTIEAMSVADIAGFHAGAYRPDRVVVAAAGALDHDRVVERLAARLPAGVGAADPLDRRPPPAAAGARRAVERPTEQVHVVVGTRTVGALDDDRFPLEVLNQALGGGISSRLFQEVREERGLAYSVYSYRSSWSDAGVLAFYAGTTPATTGEVVDLLAEGFDRVGSSGLTERELAIAKGQVVNSTVLGLEDSGARMHRLGHNQLVHGRVEPLEEHLDRYRCLSADDVGKVAAGLAGAPLSLAAIGPVGETLAP